MKPGNTLTIFLGISSHLIRTNNKQHFPGWKVRSVYDTLDHFSRDLRLIFNLDFHHSATNLPQYERPNVAFQRARLFALRCKSIVMQHFEFFLKVIFWPIGKVLNIYCNPNYSCLISFNQIDGLSLPFLRYSLSATLAFRSPSGPSLSKLVNIFLIASSG